MCAPFDVQWHPNFSCMVYMGTSGALALPANRRARDFHGTITRSLILRCGSIVASSTWVYSCWSYGGACPNDDFRQVGEMSEGLFPMKIHKRHYPFLAGTPSSHPSGARAGQVFPTSLFVLSFPLKSQRGTKC